MAKGNSPQQASLNCPPEGVSARVHLDQICDELRNRLLSCSRCAELLGELENHLKDRRVAMDTGGALDETLASCPWLTSAVSDLRASQRDLAESAQKLRESVALAESADRFRLDQVRIQADRLVERNLENEITFVQLLQETFPPPEWAEA